MTPQTQLYRGMALVREGGALLARGDKIDGGKRAASTQARELFEAAASPPGRRARP